MEYAYSARLVSLTATNEVFITPHELRAARLTKCGYVAGMAKDLLCVPTRHLIICRRSSLGRRRGCASTVLVLLGLRCMQRARGIFGAAGDLALENLLRLAEACGRTRR